TQLPLSFGSPIPGKTAKLRIPARTHSIALLSRTIRVRKIRVSPPTRLIVEGPGFARPTKRHRTGGRRALARPGNVGRRVMRWIWRVATAAGLCVGVAGGPGRREGSRAGGRGAGAAPAPPAAPTPPAAPAAAAGAAEKAGPLKRMCAGLDECRRKICKTPLGQLFNGMTAPLTAATGGIFPPFCPLMPSAKDLEQ